MSDGEVGLPEALERAASALPEHADAIRPANGDPLQLQRLLGPSGSVQVLSWLLCNESDAGAELMGCWAEDSGGGADLLQRIDATGLPKPARKVLRRALHQLRSRGVSVSAVERAPVIAKLPTIEDDIDAALVTPFDPRGARVVYLTMKHPSGGVRLFEVMIDDERGVLEFEVYNAGRSRVRKFLRDFERREHFAAVPVAPDSVRALIARALHAERADRPLPRGFSEWRSRISEPPEGTLTPGEIVRDALGGVQVDTTERLGRVVARIASGELGPWAPSDDALRELTERIVEIGDSPIEVSGAQREERLLGLIDDAADALYSGSFAQLTAGRFEEAAYLGWKAGREGDARACLSAARAFRDGEAARHPLARAALESRLAPILDQARSAEKEEPASSSARS